MQALIYYLSYPLIFLIVNSPFWLLYILSDILYVFLFYIFGYRKKVVLKNLKASFPEKSEEEIKDICKKSFHYLCDLIVETLKTVGWNEKKAKSRVKMNNVELIDRLHAEGKSFIIVSGHYGNWEWAGPCFSLHCKHQLFVIYQPLSNPYFEKLFCYARTKFNTKIVPRKETLKSIIGNRKTISATALVADQAPVPVKNALWMNFLNQPTAVFNGPEKIAKKMDYPVVYMDTKRVKRGYYELTPTLLYEFPKETVETEITIGFNKRLEESILKQPETWLWSHKRWKHKPPTDVHFIA